MPKNIIIALALGIALFSVFKYTAALREKYALLNSLNQVKEQAVALETEKQNLLQQLEKEKQIEEALAQQKAALKDNLKASRERLTKLFGQTQRSIAQLNAQISILKAESQALAEEKDKLTAELAQAAQENDNLKARLGSLTELKRAMQELRRQVRRVGSVIKEKAEAEKILEGNRGFLIKDGKVTYPLKVKIEVVPAPGKKQ